MAVRLIDRVIRRELPDAFALEGVLFEFFVAPHTGEAVIAKIRARVHKSTILPPGETMTDRLNPPTVMMIVPASVPCRPVGRFMVLLLVSSSLACARAGSDAETGPAGDTSGGGGPGSPEGGGILVTPTGGGTSVPIAATDGAAPVLTVTVRDFKFWDQSDPMTNPDFENVVADDHGSTTSGPSVVGTIVQEALGADGKPVYKGGSNGMTVTTHGKTYFDQWYNDVSGINIRFTIPLPLSLISAAQGTYGYDSQASGIPLSTSDPTKMWFPIDNQGFGNQWANHNYSFTTELHTLFTYQGGETFSFSGDDDVFVFINGKLVIDLGGVHAREVSTVNLDSLALTKGLQYPLDLFNAERHNPGSNLSFTTTLTLRPNPTLR